MYLFVARQFAIRVDPTALPPGAHYAEVCAYDVSKCFQGALFRVPVTVLIPSQLVWLSCDASMCEWVLFRMSDNNTGLFVCDEMDFQRMPVHMFFLPVPLDVTWAGEVYLCAFTLWIVCVACMILLLLNNKFTTF